MKLSDYIVESLCKAGIKCVFGYQGGNIAHVIDSVERNDKIRFVTTYNEQGASFAACGYAQATQGIGAACASSGPGAINLISGIANAYYDSIPCIFITGNVSLHTMKTDSSIRQNAFQENDIVAMVREVTKYSVTVRDAEEIRYHMEKALFMAREGRPGPVLLDLPHNIQKADIEPEKLCGFLPETEEKDSLLLEKVEEVKSHLQAARRPVVVLGGGAASERARVGLESFLNQYHIPVVTTLRGLDAISHDHACYFGFGGAYGNRYANLALKYSDLLLVLGSRLDERFLATNDKAIFYSKHLIHVDIDQNELNHILPETVSIHCTVEDFLENIVKPATEAVRYDAWMDVLCKWRKRFPSISSKGEFCTNNVAFELTKHAPEHSAFFVDIGISQMSVAQTAHIGKHQRIFTSAGHGAMGYSLPAAIGAACADGVSCAICMVGDGALHMNIQELLMLAKNKLPVHVVLFNNSCLGMIRDYQEKVFQSRHTATVEEFRSIDYETLAKAYGIEYLKIQTKEDMQQAVCSIQTPYPGLIEVVLDEKSNTLPQLGVDMFTQLPLLTAQEILDIELEAQNATI